jgi:hypothetical protein
VAEPQIEIRFAALEPGRPELGCFVGWYCVWNGLEYGDVIARVTDDEELGAAAAAFALIAGEATMKEVTDAQS